MSFDNSDDTVVTPNASSGTLMPFEALKFLKSEVLEFHTAQRCLRTFQTAQRRLVTYQLTQGYRRKYPHILVDCRA